MPPIPEWRGIPGYNQYIVSSFGQVRRAVPNSRHRAFTLVRGGKSPDGYRCVTLLADNGRSTLVGVHRLVALAFLPNPRALPYVAHNDGSRTNNAATNLRWATNADNQRDRKKHGTCNSGSRNGHAKMTEKQVAEIKSRLTGCRGEVAKIARQYNVPFAIIYNIAIGRTWKHIEPTSVQS